MPRSQSHMISDGLKLSLGYAEQLVQGVSSDNFGRMAAPGGEAVKSNHPAFIYGHLALYAPRIVRLTGGDVPVLPAEFSEVFANGVNCVDDPDGAVYPGMEVITETFFSGYKVAQGALSDAPDEVLSLANPAGGALVEKFPTIGSMCNFLCSGHIMLHLGQMSAWRRMQGLGPAA